RAREGAQDRLGARPERVQEYVAGMAAVRAYALEPRARADFGRANAEYLRLSLALARTEAGFSPLMGLIAGVGTLVVIWAGGRAVVDERLPLGALVAFNGYLAYLTWPTMALGWTLSIVRRGLTSMTRLEEIVGASRAETGFVVAGSVRPALTEGGLTEMRAGSDTPGPSVSD